MTDTEANNQDDPNHQPEEAIEVRPNNIFLLGIMGCGKTSIGWRLARRLGFGFIDLDQYVEARAKRSVKSIFENQGEAAFRELEQSALKSLQGIMSHVIALGGGTLENDANLQFVQEHGRLVWLNPPPEQLAYRLVKDPDGIASRPLLRDLDTESAEQKNVTAAVAERLAALIGQREPRYRLADLTLEDGYSPPEVLVEEIVAELSKS